MGTGFSSSAFNVFFCLGFSSFAFNVFLSGFFFFFDRYGFFILCCYFLFQSGFFFLFDGYGFFILFFYCFSQYGFFFFFSFSLMGTGFASSAFNVLDLAFEPLFLHTLWNSFLDKWIFLFFFFQPWFVDINTSANKFLHSYHLLLLYFFYHPCILFNPMSIKCLPTHFIIIIIIQESMCDLSLCVEKFI